VRGVESWVAGGRAMWSRGTMQEGSRHILGAVPYAPELPYAPQRRRAYLRTMRTWSVCFQPAS